jgi:hypothetical protein
MWTDKTWFMREGVFNVNSGRTWGRDYPGVIDEDRYEVPFIVSVWPGVVEGMTG